MKLEMPKYYVIGLCEKWKIFIKVISTYSECQVVEAVTIILPLQQRAKK
jgi:hypothetical protein